MPVEEMFVWWLVGWSFYLFALGGGLARRGVESSLL